MKHRVPHISRGGFGLASLRRWWKSQPQARRQTLLGRAAVSTGAFLFFAGGMPVLAGLNSERLDDHQLRVHSERLALADDPSMVVRSEPGASRLLEHDWLRAVEYSLERNPDAALNRFAALERDRAALKGLKSFETLHMSRAEDMMRQAQCMAEAVYYEARSERTSGQLAVAEVILNRVKDHRYPNSVCEVVYQGATRTTGCQFTFTCDGAMDRAPRGWRWEKAQSIAQHALMDLSEPRTGGATHYHATYVNPVWNSGLIRTSRIGTHIFYRFPRGSEWATASARQRARTQENTVATSKILPAGSLDAAEPSVIKTSGDAGHEMMPRAGGDAAPAERSSSEPPAQSDTESDEITVTEAETTETPRSAS